MIISKSMIVTGELSAVVHTRFTFCALIMWNRQVSTPRELERRELEQKPVC